MSAQALRKAAALMRRRARGATGGAEWWDSIPAGVGTGRVFCGQEIIAKTHEHPEGCQHNAEHIASWHPGVALAVADWLDNAAEDAEMQAPDGDLRSQWDMRIHIATRFALGVANAYIGEPT